MAFARPLPHDGSLHGDEAGVQGRSTDEVERIDVQSPLSPMVARQLARRRADRPRHLSPTAADEPARRLPAGPAAVAFFGVLLVIVALGVALVALWPRESGDDGELVATNVPTTEPQFPDSADGAATRQADGSPTTERGDAPATTDPTSTTGDGSSTTAEPGTSTTSGSGGTGGTTTTGGSGGGGTSTTGPTTSNPPPTAEVPGSSAPPQAPDPEPSTTTTTAAPAPGDPDQAATWYQLAECETGGDWTSRDDGRYGGLNIRVDDWRDHGGSGYPHQHSPETQITIARRIQADEGWDYWGRCARRLGYV